MAGNQVLEWFDIDSEIKTANLKDVSTAEGMWWLGLMLIGRFAGSVGAPGSVSRVRYGLVYVTDEWILRYIRLVSGDFRYVSHVWSLSGSSD